MSKVICEFCGTSYPETASQCPICGSVRSNDNNEIMGILEETSTEHEYHYVKGGRFSEKNVRKRNASRKSSEKKIKEEIPENEKSNKGLVITIFVLLLAIALVIVYIAVTFFGSDFKVNDLRDEILPSSQVTEATEVTVDLSCKEIRLNVSEINMEEIGAQVQLEPILIPANTYEQATYFTDNDAVATVTTSGLVSAIGSGEATITIRCGSASVQCKIIVAEPEMPFVLAFEDITFTKMGDNCLLYSGPADIGEIVWASEDENIAFVQNGNVYAAGAGMTTIYASYNGETATCVVRCEFEEEEDPTEAPTEETQVPIVDNGPYQLKNAFGFSNSDVTIRIGESFTLILIDKDGNKVNGVLWSVADGNSCSVVDGVVTGDSSGKATVIATFNGKEYKCLVRVS